MVLDATASAFPQLATLGNQSHSAVNQPILAAAKPSIAQSVPDTSNRPAKRRRTLQANVNDSPMTSSPGPSSASSTIDFDALDAARRRSSARVMSLWESLAARYARPLDEDDEIDILTGKIYKDRGVLRAASEKGWKIGSFGETIEVEPVVSASEAETETGTSECDDAEGEDTAGDTEDADEEEEDPFETWSYDWQYRQLPPPRPELSPQDAEDLKEFLAAEHAIQEENMRTSGNQPKLAEDEDEVVYLGDNLHDQDGALLGDDSDDEEFASFAVDDTTVRLTKHEEDEEDSIGPMSSILGALALGKTPQKRLSASTRTESPVDTKTAKLVDSSGQSTRVRAETHGTPSIGNARPNTSPSANARSGPKARIEDDIIDIDSDTDQEDDADMGSALDSSPSAKDRVSKLSAPGVRPALSVSDSSGIVRQGRTSFSAMVASLQASTIVDEPKLKTTAVSPCSTPPRSKSATKPTSKGMRSNTTTTTKNTKASSTPRTSASGSLPSPANTLKKRPGAATPTTPVRSAAPTPKLSSRPNAISPSRPVETSAGPTSLTAHKASAKTPLKRTDKPERSFVATTEPRNEPTREMVGGGTDAVNSKPAKGNTTIPVSEPPGSSTPAVGKASKPAQLASPPISSSSRSARPESPTKSRRKPLVMEVVLAPRSVSKPISQPAGSHSSATFAKPVAVNSPAAGSRPSVKSMAASEAKPSVQASNTTEERGNREPENVALASAELQVKSTRKRARESGEGLKSEDNSLEPQRQAKVIPTQHPQTVDQTYSCCSPMSLGLGHVHQPACCSMPLGCLPAPLQPPQGCSHSHSQGSCSHSHQVHHCSSVHQHQHQHLHTHLPFPLPQHVHSFTANELTEAALKLMYGLGAMHPSGASGHAHQTWLPPGMHVSYTPTAMGIVQGQVRAEPSTPASPPKLEPESSSQEEIPDSQEKIPSSQEHERRKEEEKQKGKRKNLTAQPNSKDKNLPLLLSNPQPLSPRSIPQKHATSSRPRTPPGSYMDVVSSATPKDLPSSPKTKISTPKREPSVIDIESDSDDELADFNAGEGSMRWIPPVKDEVESDGAIVGLSDSEDDIMLLGKLGEGKSKRRLRPGRDHEKHQPRRQTSPSKLRKVI